MFFVRCPLLCFAILAAAIVGKVLVLNGLRRGFRCGDHGQIHRLLQVFVGLRFFRDRVLRSLVFQVRGHGCAILRRIRIEKLRVAPEDMIDQVRCLDEAIHAFRVLRRIRQDPVTELCQCNSKLPLWGDSRSEQGVQKQLRQDHVLHVGVPRLEILQALPDVFLVPGGDHLDERVLLLRGTHPLLVEVVAEDLEKSKGLVQLKAQGSSPPEVSLVQRVRELLLLLNHELVLHDLPLLLFDGHVLPNHQRAIRTAREEVAPVVRCRQRPDLVTVSVDRRFTLVCPNRPDLDQPVGSAARQLHAVPQEGHVQDRAGVALEGLQALPVREPPDLDRPISAARRNCSVYWRELDHPNAPLVALQLKLQV
eukprot:scaffold52_cov246-Pinguiococcus_pyrenoidosus.AAC.6